jgi:hypothetical protein
VNPTIVPLPSRGAGYWIARSRASTQSSTSVDTVLFASSHVTHPSAPTSIRTTIRPPISRSVV